MYLKSIIIINLIFLNIVQSSVLPESIFNNEDNRFPLINNESIEKYNNEENISSNNKTFSLNNNAKIEESSEEELQKEYDYFSDYHHSQNVEEKPEELNSFIESLPTVKVEILHENKNDNINHFNSNEGTTDITKVDMNDIRSEASGDNMSEDQKELLLQLQQMLNIDGTVKNQLNKQSLVAPQFMTDLYQAKTDPISGISIRNNPHGASEVWSALETNPSIPSLFHFDLTAMDFEQLIEAELHVFRTGINSPTSINHPPYYLLRVYQVMPTPKNSLSLNPDVHQLLNVHYVPSFGTGWQVFKVTRAVESWRNGSSPNLGFLVSATTILNEPVDVRFSRNGDKYQPALILFINKEKNKEIVGHSADFNRNFNTPKMEKIYHKREISENLCSVKPLYIDFKTMGWSDFIIAPPGFEAHQCRGECNANNTTNKSFTNHAKLRNMLSKIGVDTSPACCAPLELKPVSILYFNNDHSISLKDMTDMIVGKCGCQ